MMRKATFILIVVALVGATSSCRKTGEGSGVNNLAVINAPVTGQVRRVLVREGARVNEGTTIIEIAVQRAAQGSQGATVDPQSQSRAAVETSLKEIVEAEADAQRALVDVQRAEQSVASGLGSQADVEAARARNQVAQQRLDELRGKAQTARDNLTFQRGRNAPAPAAPREEIVAVQVTAPGTVRAISSRVGQQVTQGQPLATVLTDKR
jgi:multidrug efflux pump subunit AcrA (membrane-fusion protein)